MMNSWQQAMSVDDMWDRHGDDSEANRCAGCGEFNHEGYKCRECDALLCSYCDARYGLCAPCSWYENDKERQPMTDELRECPFCGGEAQLDGHAMEWWVKCRECDALIHLVAAAPQHAIEAWNRRAAPVTGWIAVGERLPTDGDVVILFVAELDGGEVVAWSQWIGCMINDMWLRSSNLERVVEPFAVTHWQPLPPPPGSDEPAPDDERREVGEALIAWAADEPSWWNSFRMKRYCIFCRLALRPGQHKDDCLHLRAKALRGEGEVE